MVLSKHISDLLYRYECVIVPNFGGFVSRSISSTVINQQFTAPTKEISFNVNLNQNDGLLVNHLRQTLNLSYQETLKLILDTVKGWNKDLENGTLSLNNIGSFHKTQDQLIFTPFDKINYLTSSFGLTDVGVNYILRKTEEATPIIQEIVKKKSYTKPVVAAIAASVALLFSGHFYIQNKIHKQEIAQQQKITQQIQQASFNILAPLPSLTLNVTKENSIKENITEDISYKYHIIAGAYKSEENAYKKVDLLAKKGYQATIIGLNKWGLNQVSYASFNNKTEAIKVLKQIKQKDNSHAWLLINE